MIMDGIVSLDFSYQLDDIHMSVDDATSTRNHVVLAVFCLESVDLRNFVRHLILTKMLKKSCTWPFAIDCSFT